MKTKPVNLSFSTTARAAVMAFAVIAVGCGRQEARLPRADAVNGPTLADPLAIVLAPHAGEGKVDVEIRRRQEQCRENPDIALERLGWLFAAKARESFDTGYYKLAEQSALALERRLPRSAEALLLRAHVLQNLHRFHDAEVVARELVAARGLAFDHGVLGDALMEQGRLDEAVEAYQKMADLKPDAQAAMRAAHIRWLKGDLAGAIEMMWLAASAVSARDADDAAWVFTRLAGYQFQAAEFDEAKRTCASALELRSDYPPALLLRGKMLLNEGKTAEAVEALRPAEKQNPLPEYQWALADALDADGRGAEARVVEAKLHRFGASADPRSFSLFLATRGERSHDAQRFAEEEFKTRADVFTHDAVAWAQFAQGNFAEAQQSMERALAAGTQDARLFLHAGIIATHAGQTDVGEKFFQKSSVLAHLLWPSERKQLYTVVAQPAGSREVAASAQAEAILPLGGSRFSPFENSTKNQNQKGQSK